MRRRWRGVRGASPDAGAATAEMTGVYALAALLVVAVLVAVVPGTPLLGDAARRAICTVVTLGQGACAPLVTSASDHLPKKPCVTHAQGHTSNVQVAALVTVGGGERYLVEQLSDGQYRITRGQSASLGAEVGVGATLTVTWDDKAYGGGASAGASVDLGFTGGDVYYVDAQGRDALLSEHWEDNVEDVVIGSGGPIRGLWEWGQDATGLGGQDFPDVHERYIEAGVTVGASADATALVVDVGASAGAAQVLGYRVGSDGTRTTYMSVTLEGEAGLSMWASGQDGDFEYGGGATGGSVEAVLEVEHDADGEVTAVRARAAAAGEIQGGGTAASFAFDENSRSGYVERSMELPIRSDTDRQVAMDFLRGTGVVQIGGLPVPGVPPGQAMADPLGTAAGVLGFADAVSDRGYTTDQSYTLDTSSYGADVGGEIIAEVGGSLEVETTDRVATGARYWDGSSWQPWAGCAA